MNLKIQVIVAALIVFALLWIANMVRRQVLDLKYALSWLTVGTAVLILDLRRVLFRSCFSLDFVLRCFYCLY